MTDLLPAWPLLSAFFVASLVLAITPGPGVFYIVTRSVTQGRSAGLASMAGVALGNLGNAIGASLGLAALFMISSLAFTIVKFAGAGYLIYLGIQALRASDAGQPKEVKRQSNLTIMRDGFIVALFNPKTAIFFAAFLPQFMHSRENVVAQSVALGVLFVFIAAMTDSMYAVFAGSVAPRLSRVTTMRAAGRYLTGTAFIGLGLLTALTGTRKS